MGQYPEHLIEVIAEEMGTDLHYDDYDLTEEDVIIEEFIRESRMFGFDISLHGDKFTSTAKCNRCGREFTVIIDISVVDINGEKKVKCTLPIYCNGCKEVMK
jgi:hypothetical protein